MHASKFFKASLGVIWLNLSSKRQQPFNMIPKTCYGSKAASSSMTSRSYLRVLEKIHVHTQRGFELTSQSRSLTVN